MTTPKSDESPVIVRYDSFSNITFHGTVDLGYTWGEWREMEQDERDNALALFLFELVDVSVEGEE